MHIRVLTFSLISALSIAVVGLGSQAKSDISGDISAAIPTAHALSSARKTVTLAIGGGALKSVGCLGVLRVLEKEHIDIDFIYGTSCGATIGALYAAGVPLSQIEELFLSGQWQRAAGNHIYIKGCFTPLTKLVPLTRRNKWPGVLAGTHYEKLLRRLLPQTFEDLKIRFRAVATDLCTGDPVVIGSGDLPMAVLASNAMPPAIRPIESGNQLLADGGLRRNLPVLCAKRRAEGDIVIAACSDGPLRKREKGYFSSLQRIQRRVADCMSFQADVDAMSEADVSIIPDIDDLPVMTKNRKKVQAAIEAGQLAATEAIPKLRQTIGIAEP